MGGRSLWSDPLNGRRTRTLSSPTLPHQLAPRFLESMETGPNPSSTGWLPSKVSWLLVMDVVRGRFRLLDLLSGRHTRMPNLLTLLHQLAPKCQELKETGPSLS